MKRLLVLLLLFGLFGCDPSEQLKGIVLDKATNKPIAGVVVISTDDPESHSLLTGKDGSYNVLHLGDNSDKDYIFYKYGYVPKKKRLKSGPDIILTYLDSAVQEDSSSFLKKKSENDTGFLKR